ncbi:hypothetical protein F2Q70_00038931 [Brassica cretica]|uniref:Uncharacterized protein n=1 Tax=Brassica cretica TaxID=69181 RepID=A0A3N6PQG5_BRACR|nr:hypothetical protein F2Q70_00038931 [Brassica cretica]
MHWSTSSYWLSSKAISLSTGPNSSGLFISSSTCNLHNILSGLMFTTAGASTCSSPSCPSTMFHESGWPDLTNARDREKRKDGCDEHETQTLNPLQVALIPLDTALVWRSLSGSLEDNGMSLFKMEMRVWSMDFPCAAASAIYECNLAC